MPAYNLSPIALNELENAFETLAKVHPEQAIRLADMLWEQDMYEPKKLAIMALAALLPPHHEVFIEHARRWIPQGLPDSLIGEIMERSSLKPEIVASPQWSALMRAWIWSQDKSLQKIGMRAAGNMARSKEFKNLPLVLRTGRAALCPAQDRPAEKPDRTDACAHRPLRTGNGSLPHLAGGNAAKERSLGFDKEITPPV